MNLTNQLYRQFVDLVLEVKEDFRSRGIVLPSKDSEGRVKLGNYSVVKKDTGFYAVVGPRNRIIHDNINLPHTALLIANALALGKWVNDDLLKQDEEYGFSKFECENFQRLSAILTKKGEWDRYDALLIKQEQAVNRAYKAKQDIVLHFEKLRLLR